MNSNRDRLKFLQIRVNQLAAEIERAEKQTDYLSYLEQIRAMVVQPSAVSETAFDLMLPVERERNLLAHYHTMRSELIQLTRKLEQPGTLEKLNAWLDRPVVQLTLATATLVETANVLIEVLKASGLFLRVSTSDDDMQK